MPTATQSSASVPAGVLGSTKSCSECDNLIHPARLARHPNTDLCARCQEQVGDVESVTDKLAAGYGSSRVVGFSMVPKEEESVRRRNQGRPIQTVTWNELRPHKDDIGNATATGLHVNSERGLEARRENGRKSWERRRAQQ